MGQFRIVNQMLLLILFHHYFQRFNLYKNYALLSLTYPETGFALLLVDKLHYLTQPLKKIYKEKRYITEKGEWIVEKRKFRFKS